VGELERKLFALPVCLGELGLADPSTVVGFGLNTSELVMNFGFDQPNSTAAAIIIIFSE